MHCCKQLTTTLCTVVLNFGQFNVCPLNRHWTGLYFITYATAVGHSVSLWLSNVVWSCNHILAVITFKPSNHFKFILGALLPPSIPIISFILTMLSGCCIYYLLTYSMEQSSSWEANCSAASQEIPCILWNPKVHHCTHKRPPPVPILSQIHPVHTPSSHFPKIHPNIILPSMPGSPQWSPFLRPPHQNPVHTSLLPHTHHMPCTSHSSWFYHPHNIGWGELIIQLLIM
jgi:hypothetical protein